MKHWAPSEIETLRIRFERGDRLEHIAGDLHRSFYAVFVKARRLGLKRCRVDRAAPCSPILPSAGRRYASLREGLRADLDAQGLYRFDDPRHAPSGAP